LHHRFSDFLVFAFCFVPFFCVWAKPAHLPPALPLLARKEGRKEGHLEEGIKEGPFKEGRKDT
jgi:hypothetical protein